MATADKAGVLQIQRTLKNGDLVGILPDQDPGEEGGILAPFFNKEVNTMTLLVRLAKKHNAQVLMFWLYKHYNVQTVLPFYSLFPVFGIVLTIILIKEPISLYIILGSFIVISGNYLLQKNK